MAAEVLRADSLYGAEQLALFAACGGAAAASFSADDSSVMISRLRGQDVLSVQAGFFFFHYE